MSTSESLRLSPQATSRGEPVRSPKRWLSVVVEGGVWVLIILTPLALGSVSETATALMELGCFTLFLVGWWGNLSKDAAPVPWGLRLLAGMFVAWTVFQLLPLPESVLRRVAPGTAELYSKYLPGYGATGRPTELQPWLMTRRDDESGSLSPARGDATGYEKTIVPRPAWEPVSWYPSRTWKWLSRFLAYWAIFLVTARMLPDRARRKRLPWLLLGLGFGIALFGILQAITWNGKIYWVIRVYQGYPFGPWVNSNHFSGYLEMALPIGLGVLLQESGLGSRAHRRRRSIRSGRPRQLLIGFMLVMMAIALGMSFSRGGIFSMGLTAGLVILARLVRVRHRVRWGKWGLVAAAVPLLLALGGTYWYTYHGPTENRPFESGVEPSFESRVRVWKAIAHMAAANPIAGTGLGTFGTAFRAYATYGETGLWEQAHNDYLQLLAESGAVGFGLAMAALILVLRRALWPTLSVPWSKAAPVAVGAALGILTLLLHSLVDFNLQIPSNGLLFCLLGGVLMGSLPARIEGEGAARGGGGETPEAGNDQD